MVLLYTALQVTSFLLILILLSPWNGSTPLALLVKFLFRYALASCVEEVNFFSHCQLCELRHFIETAIFSEVFYNEIWGPLFKDTI